MAVKTDKFGVKAVANVTFFDVVTNEPVLFFDTLKASNIVTTAKVTDARGGQGNAKLITWEFEKEATLTMSDALLDPKAVAAKHGTTAVVGIAVIQARETLVTIADSTNTCVNLLNIPKEAAAVIWVYKPDGSKIVATTLTVKKLVFLATDAPIGTQLVVYYTYDSAATANTISIDASKFAGYYRVVGDTVLRNNRTKLDEAYQFVLPMAKLSSDTNIQLQSDGDPQPIEFKLDLQRTAASDQMIKLIKY